MGEPPSGALALGEIAPLPSFGGEPAIIASQESCFSFGTSSQHETAEPAALGGENTGLSQQVGELGIKDAVASSVTPPATERVSPAMHLAHPVTADAAQDGVVLDGLASSASFAVSNFVSAGRLLTDEGWKQGTAIAQDESLSDTALPQASRAAPADPGPASAGSSATGAEWALDEDMDEAVQEAVTTDTGVVSV